MASQAATAREQLALPGDAGMQNGPELSASGILVALVIGAAVIAEMAETSRKEQAGAAGGADVWAVD